MKLISMLVLVVGLVGIACAEQPDEHEQPGQGEQQVAQGAEPSLLRMTWENNSCLLPRSEKKCWQPTAFRHGDSVSLRELPRKMGESGSERRIVLSFIQHNGREFNTFFGTIENEEHSDTGRLLEIKYLDDPVDAEMWARKTLTVQQVRSRGDGSSDDTCSQRIDQLGEGNFRETARRVCNAHRYPNLLHWKIATECEVEPGTEDCISGQLRMTMPPDDGQGTGSGRD